MKKENVNKKAAIFVLMIKGVLYYLTGKIVLTEFKKIQLF